MCLESAARQRSVSKILIMRFKFLTRRHLVDSQLDNRAL